MIDVVNIPYGRSFPLGATCYEQGVNFSIFSKNASKVHLLLFDHPEDARPTKVIELDSQKNRTFYYWHIFVEGLKPGQLYGYSIDGPYDPRYGHFFDPDKLLIDPYARSIVCNGHYSRVEAMRPGNNWGKAMKCAVIDPKDYELALAEVRANFEQARFEREVETGRQVIAKREWNSFGKIDATDEQRSLAQREPQLESALLSVKAAESALKKAELDLQRATLRAPFNAMVVAESVDLGQLVSPQMTVARLVGTDEYHVQVSVPVSSLRTIHASTEDTPGSLVTIIQRVGNGTIERDGEVIRQLPDLDPGGAMARILVRIKNPLGEKGGLPLLLGSFVDVAVRAQPIDDAIRVPRVALRNGRDVYVMNEEGLLEIREVEIAWSEPDAVLVTSGLEPDERVVISRIATAIPNMLLRTAEPAPQPTEPGPSEPAARAIP